MLGAPVAADLRFRADAACATALTFRHASLALELARPDDPEAEPSYWFPNCWMEAVDDGSGGHAHVRVAAGGGFAPVAAGGALERRLPLEVGYGLELLDVGPHRLAYSMGEDAEHRSPAVTFDVVSGPEAVPLLIDILANDASRCGRAAGLLRRLGARGFGFDAEAAEKTRAGAAAGWRAWWIAEGRALRWSFETDGAAFRPSPERSGTAPRVDGRLGGVVHRTVHLDPRRRWDLLGVLRRWVREPSPRGRLPGERRVADTVIAYPEQASFLELCDGLTEALRAALGRFVDESPLRDSRAADLDKVIETIRRVAPSPALVPALTELELTLEAGPAWRSARQKLRELLDAWDPMRVPVWTPVAGDDAG